MRLATISPKQRAILTRLAGADEASFKEIGRACRVSEQAVRRFASATLSAGWLRPFCFINHAALGLQTFNLLFSCPREKHASVVRHLKQDPRVVWATENVGHPRYQVTAVSRTAAEITALFTDIARSCKTPITSRYLSLEVSLEYWGSRMLSSQPAAKRVSIAPQERITYDLLDLKILDALRSSEEHSVAMIARALKEAQSTISYRLSRLRAREVVSPLLYRLSPQRAGGFSCEFLLTLARVEGDIEEALLRFCDTTPGVALLIRAFGMWDYKLVVEAESFDGLLDTRDLLESALPEAFHDVMLVIKQRVLTERCHFQRHSDLLRGMGAVD
jgi:DNA-binding Lrp family transcriptional regulator